MRRIAGRIVKRAAPALVAAAALLAALETAGESVPAPLPPEPAWDGASRALLVDPDDPWATPFERSGRTTSPDYAATVEWLERLAAAAPQLRLTAIGRSHEGREIVMVVASREGAASPAELRAGGRPTVLLQAGIHAGEIDGKDATLMLLRDATVRGVRRELLERVNLLFVPILSVDGHERRTRHGRINQRGPERTGWRANARNLDLNRDYAKLETPEIRAIVGAIESWEPELYVDVHVTDGIDYQHDVTFGWNGPHAHSPRIATWLDGIARPALDGALEQKGHVPGPLIFAVNPLDVAEGIWDWTAPARFSHGYGDLRHLPTILVENHSLKSFERRVLGTYVFVEALLRTVAAEAESLRAAIRADRERRPARVPLAFVEPEATDRTFRLLGIDWRIEDSEVSGGKRVVWTGRPRTLEVPVRANDRPAKAVEVPAAYWIPPGWAHLVEKLERHGVRVERIERARTLDVIGYRLREAQLEDAPYEGRVRVAARPEPEPRRETFPAGSARVPTDQPLGELVVQLLEPEGADSFFRWGFFHEVLRRVEYAEAYVLEPLAERMLAEDPQLAERFRRRLESDDAFREDPAARLRWFYERSPWFDERHLLYPVAREPRPAR